MSAEQKRIVRAQVRARLMRVNPEQRAQLSALATALLLDQPEWRRARVVMGYLALPDELDIGEALQAGWKTGKTVGLPRYLPERGVYGAAEYRGETLATRAFGIREPGPDAPELSLNRLDLALVPGVAFDYSGKRLGRGKGFYDRLLAEASGLKCGVALEEQLVEKLPSEAHDIAMDFLLTPSRWIDVRSAAK